MKINCGRSFPARFAAKMQWHRWFAWHPIRLSEGDCRWLEYVERKGEYDDWEGGWNWDYRESDGT